MEMHCLAKDPIQPNQPAGSDVRYEPEYEQLQAEIDKLSIKFDDETFFKLASMAGITGTELPDKMETINQIMEVLPYDVSEWILIEFLNNLMVQPAD